MKHNLFTPMIGALNYPHCTMIKGDIVSIVTNPSKAIKVDDVVYSEGDKGIQISPKRVAYILEQRTARGEHSVDFKPIFQKLKVEAIRKK